MDKSNTLIFCRSQKWQAKDYRVQTTINLICEYSYILIYGAFNIQNPIEDPTRPYFIEQYDLSRLPMAFPIAVHSEQRSSCSNQLCEYIMRSKCSDGYLKQFHISAYINQNWKANGEKYGDQQVSDRSKISVMVNTMVKTTELLKKIQASTTRKPRKAQEELDTIRSRYILNK